MNKKLNDMKRIIAILLLLALGWGAQAQFAGPDKRIVREPHNRQTTTLGEPDASADACYIWTGPHIVGNANQPVITVNPIDTLEVYQVKRISKNGVEEDQAEVHVEDSVIIKYVFAKYQCYNHGEEISTSQFDITTEPKGYENLVTVSPSVANNNAGFSIENNVPVTFTLTKNGHTSTMVKNITVFNSDLTISQNLGQGLSNIRRLLMSFTLVNNALEDLKKCTRPLDFIKRAPCRWSDTANHQSGAEASGALDITPKLLCCGDHRMAPALQIKFGQLSKGASFGCRVPLYGVPYVATLDFVFNISGSVFVGPVDGILSTNTECAQLCFPFGATVSINGGVGGSVLGGDILKLDALVQASASATASWCPIGPKNNLKLSANLSLVGYVEMCSFVKYSIEFPLGNIQQTIDLE